MTYKLGHFLLSKTTFNENHELILRLLSEYIYQ
jgi:hypothetical protein